MLVSAKTGHAAGVHALWWEAEANSRSNWTGDRQQGVGITGEKAPELKALLSGGVWMNACIPETKPPGSLLRGVSDQHSRRRDLRVLGPSGGDV